MHPQLVNNQIHNDMKLRAFVLVSILLFSASTLLAQHTLTDGMDKNLKGDVRSVLLTTRNSKNQVMGQPVRYMFDSKGNFEHVHFFDTAGNLAITVHYQYNKKGQLVSDTRLLEPFSQLMGVSNYTYNKKNRTLTAELLLMDDTLTIKTIYTYDKRGNEIEVVNIDEFGKDINRAVKVYDENNRLKFVTFFYGENNLYKGETHYRYDTDGLLVEELELNRIRVDLSHRVLYNYEYDEKGNWIKCYGYYVTPTSAELVQVVTRTINYQD